MKNFTKVILFGVVILLAITKVNAQIDDAKNTTKLIKVSILYANEGGKTFDMDYYSNNHMPMVAELFGETLKKWEIDKGLSGRTSEDPMPYIAVGYFYFEKLTDYQDAFGANAEEILGDIPKYTDIQPIVQISEVIR